MSSTGAAAAPKRPRTQRRSKDDLDAPTGRASKGNELDARPRTKRRSKDDLDLPRGKGAKKGAAPSPSTSRVASPKPRPGSAASAGGGGGAGSPSGARATSPKAKNAPLVLKRKVVPNTKNAIPGKVGSFKLPSDDDEKPPPPSLPQYAHNKPAQRKKPSLLRKCVPRCLRHDRSSVALTVPAAQSAARGLGLTQRDLRNLRSAFNEVRRPSGGCGAR